MDINNVSIIDMDYHGKLTMLEKVAEEILKMKMEYAQISGRYAELRAQLQVLKEVKSALQSALRAEGV